MKENEISAKEIIQFLGLILSNQRKSIEIMETILYTVCKSNDAKTKESINNYLASNFRNRKVGGL